MACLDVCSRVILNTFSNEEVEWPLVGQVIDMEERRVARELRQLQARKARGEAGLEPSELLCDPALSIFCANLGVFA